jgi:hypothetical protein
MDDDAQRDFTDRALCQLLAKAENLREFLAAAVPQLAVGFDFDRMRPASQEFLVGNWRRRTPDLLVEIPFRTGSEERWAVVCVLLEHQTKSDWQAPLKSFEYAALYWEWQWRVWERAASPRPEFVLTPILPIILHTGPRPWGSARAIRELLGPPEVFHAFAPDWQPVFWELAAHSTEELLNSKAAFLQALTILKADAAELADAERLFTEIFQRLDPLHETGRVRWRDLLGFLLGWAQNRRPSAERREWHDLATGLHHESNRRREIENMGKTIAQSLMAEAEVAYARRTLLKLGRKRFGPPTEDTVAAVNAITEIDRLDRLIERLDDVKSWDELLTAE